MSKSTDLTRYTFLGVAVSAAVLVAVGCSAPPPGKASRYASAAAASVALHTPI